MFYRFWDIGCFDKIVEADTEEDAARKLEAKYPEKFVDPDCGCCGADMTGCAVDEFETFAQVEEYYSDSLSVFELVV